MTNHRTEIERNVFKVVADTFPDTSVTLTASTLLKEDLGADSMQLIALMIALDAEFDAEFAVDRIPSHDVSLAWICDFVIATVEAKLPAAQ